MGLDMYLRKCPKCGEDKRQNDAIASFVTWIKSEIQIGCKCSYNNWCGHESTDLPDIKSLIEILEKYPLSSFNEEVTYWRKANAVHKWFVDNIQDGIDDCQRHRPVTKDDLLKLKELCDEVLKDHSLAEKLLPTSSGFFFGPLVYDEDRYFAKIEYTAKICKKLTDDDGFDFENYDLYYESSW
jgi:hypothetical protein